MRVSDARQRCASAQNRCTGKVEPKPVPGNTQQQFGTPGLLVRTRYHIPGTLRVFISKEDEPIGF